MNSAIAAGTRLTDPAFRKEGSAVSWAAIFAGAAGAAVLSMVLLLLGTGIGFSVISPWRNEGVSTMTVGVTTIVWITVVQILASLVGGYLAGRLRAKWVSVHNHEAYFRDTAHGFLAWAVATMLTATLLYSAVGSLVSGGLKAGGLVAAGAVTVAGTGAAGGAASATGSNSSGSDPLGYFTDSMFRPAAGQALPANGGTAPSPAAEVGRIFTTSLKNGSLSAPDSEYLAQLVSQRTGLSADDAQKRVNDTFTQAQEAIGKARAQAMEAADTARQASAGLALWLVLSLLIGAFTASWAATFGGRMRDGADTVAHS